MTRMTGRVIGAVAAAMTAVLLLTACNTVEGLGRDLEDLGYAIQDAAD